MKRYYIYVHTIEPSWDMFTVEDLKASIEKSKKKNDGVPLFAYVSIFTGLVVDVDDDLDEDEVKDRFIDDKTIAIYGKEPTCMLVARRQFFIDSDSLFIE